MQRFLISSRRYSVLLGIFFVLFCTLSTRVQASDSGLVISQVFAHGGNNALSFRHDFVELFNAGDAAINVNGWSVQRAILNQTQWAVIPLPDVVIAPGAYYLIQLGNLDNPGGFLPVPDLIGDDAITLADTGGRVILATNATPLFGLMPDDASIEDLVGYGSANHFEGSAAAPTLADNTAALRLEGGCVDTDDNGADFTTVVPPLPRNSTSAINDCDNVIVDTAPSVENTVPTTNATNVAVESAITVTFSEDVTAIGTWFTLTCTMSGAVSATVSGGAQTYTLTPDTDFANEETCTVTLFAAQITDQDGTPNPLDEDYTWQFTTIAEDTSNDDPPEVLSTTPTDNATDIAVNANIAISFSEPVDAPTSAFALTCTESNTINVTVSGGTQNYLLNPVEDFINGETCTVTITAAQIIDRDDEPTAMSDDYTWQFIVVDAPPEVAGVSPVADSDNAPITTTISVNFSEDVTFTEDSYTLTCTENGTISTTLTGAGRSYVITPNSNLTNDETCTVTIIATQVSDLDGASSLNMTDDFIWQFTTTSADVEDSPPVVTSVSPANGAIDIPVNTTLQITFSEQVMIDTDAAWVTFACTISGNPSITVSGGLTEFTVTPLTSFSPAETCVVTITAETVNDLDGDTFNPMPADYRWSFTTVPIGPGDVPPEVVSITPVDGATNISLNPTIAVQFSEDVAITDTWLSLTCNISGEVSTSTAGGPTTYTTTLDNTLANDDTCTVTLIAAQIQDTDSPPKTLLSDYTWQFSTLADTGECGTSFTPIYAIQGEGDTTPLSGIVVTEGIVTADFEGDTPQALGGFYLQAPTPGDDNPRTSDGIFVYAPGEDFVTVGDSVRVIGTVGEANGQTRITEPTIIRCPSSGSVTPTTVRLPLNNLTLPERYEGMLITLPQQLTVTDTSALGQYGEVGLSSGGRLFQPTQLVAPGADANTLQTANDLNHLLLDDLSNSQYPDPTPYLGTDSTLRLGDTVTNLTGILDDAFGEYRLRPIEAPTFTRTNPRTIAPELNGGSLRVASFNLKNYFNGPDFPTPRGADSLEEYTRQRDKLINTLLALNADIIGLVEIEKDGYGEASAIQDLVDDMNSFIGIDTYAFVDPGQLLGTDFITVGLIYRTTTVTPFNAAQTTIAPPYNIGRRPLAQTFEQISSGERLTVVVNHFKSKICDASATGLNADQGDGQGCGNATRVEEANVLLTWLSTDPTRSKDTDYLIMGDLNAYAMEDPITVFSNAGYTDLIAQFEGTNAHSYAFEGQSGTLDYALASASLAGQVADATVWPINADEPEYLDYNLENKSTAQQALNVRTPFRSSDHDPLLVSFDLLEVFGTDLEWVAPLGEIQTGYGNPVYEWSRVQDATEYQLYLAPSDRLGAPVLHEILATDEVCIGAVCRIDVTTLSEQFRLRNGNYTAYIRAWQGITPGAWMGPYIFTLNAPPPSAITVMTEDNRRVVSRPALTWTLEDNATYAAWFQVYLARQGNLSTPLLNQWFNRESLCGDINGIACTFTAPIDLTNGEYAVYMRSWGPGGFSIGGLQGFAEATIRINAEQPTTPRAITTTSNQGRPTITWRRDDNAAWYHIIVATGHGEATYDQWHLASDLDCGGGTCSLTPNMNLTDGNYQVTIEAWGPGGVSAGSASTDLTLSFGTPAVVTGMTATNADTGRPTFTWQGVPGATWYHLWVGTASSQTRHLQWYLAADLGCENAEVCTITPPIDLLNGDYTWFLRVWGPGGFSMGGVSGWAQGIGFTVNAAPAPIPTPITPDGITNKTNPAFTWAHNTAVTWYQVRIETVEPRGVIYEQWHSAASLTCGTVNLCQLAFTDLNLRNDDYLWSIRAFNPAGVSEWSSYRAFKVFR